MACNCGTKEEIDRIYKIYGEKLENRDDMTFIERIKHFGYVLFTIFAWIIVFPLMFIYVILFMFWNEPGHRDINVQDFNLLKIFRLGKYARK